MKEQLVSFQVAKLAKEKGFIGSTTYEYKSENCTSHREYIPHDYNLRGLLSAPTQSQLQKWLREIHKINVGSNYLPNIEKYGTLYIPMNIKPNTFVDVKEYREHRSKYVSILRFDTYEEALEIGLLRALKLI